MIPAAAERYNTGVRFTPLAAVIRAVADGREHLMHLPSPAPLRDVAVHATPAYMCPEQFVTIRLAPGETATWDRRYMFRCPKRTPRGVPEAYRGGPRANSSLGSTTLRGWMKSSTPCSKAVGCSDERSEYQFAAGTFQDQGAVVLVVPVKVNVAKLTARGRFSDLTRPATNAICRFSRRVSSRTALYTLLSVCMLDNYSQYCGIIKIILQSIT